MFISNKTMNSARAATKAINRITAATVLAGNLLTFALLPFASQAQLSAPEQVEGAVTQLESALGGGGGAALGPLYVPVNQCTIPLLCPTGTAAIATAVSTGKLSLKSIADFLATITINKAINLLRDVMIRWIVTGRFQKPVFSVSFTADLAKIAENASRIYLSQISGLNFCATFGPPPIDAFRLPLDFGLSCTLPTRADQNYAEYVIQSIYNPEQLADDLSFRERLSADNAENNKIYNFVELIRKREEAIARAVNTYSAEYAAGQGFLGIRDPETGKTKTPGSYVAKLVMGSLIEGKIQEFSAADTVQKAIVAIVDTFIQVNINKGLDQLFSQSDQEGSGGAAVPTLDQIRTGVQSAINLATNRASAYLGKPDVTELERSRIGEIVGTLGEFTTQLASANTETRVTIISNQVTYLDLRLRQIIGVSRLCAVTNPRDPVCLP